MARPISFGAPEVTLSVGEPSEYQPQPETPLRIAVLGDFRARPAGSAAGALADRRPLRIDRDNFDEVLGHFGLQLDLPLGGEENSVTVRFGELEDFHPDRLYQNLELFRSLRELRDQLGDPATFELAAARIRGPAGSKPAAAEPLPSPPAPVDPAGLLDQIVGGGTGQPAAPARRSAVEEYIRQVVEPYLTPGIDRVRQADLQATMDEAIGGQMRTLLRHPRFQALESAWRALHFLVRRLDTGAELQLYLVDASKEELAADLAGSDDVRDSGLWRMLYEGPTSPRDRQPWGLFVGLYSFGPQGRDVGLLWRLAGLAQRANAPFLAEASSRLLGSPALAQAAAPRDWQPLAAADAENWQALRQVPESRYLGLALPRLLLRQPYGKEGSTVEGFDFEELPPGSPHEAYLWGSPAVACAYLLGEAFRRQGWAMRPDDVQEITGLPLHVYREDGEARVKPCAEVALSDRAVEAILDRGLMPLLWQPGRDAVRLARMQSLASPAAALAGAWG